ncbi:hypothetical protein Hdeb2414_s0020g00566091 [Helianthus debilis subsp. tardiflorus]
MGKYKDYRYMAMPDICHNLTPDPKVTENHMRFENIIENDGSDVRAPLPVKREILYGTTSIILFSLSVLASFFLSYDMWTYVYIVSCI